MQACDVYRYLCMTLRENCASVKYSDDGRRVDVSGAWGDAPSFDDLRALRRCNSAVYRGWLAGCNGDADAESLERKAAEALDRARAIVAGWGKSPAGGWCEIDGQTAADAGAVVLVCHDAQGIPRRVDFVQFFGREG